MYDTFWNYLSEADLKNHETIVASNCLRKELQLVYSNDDIEFVAYKAKHNEIGLEQPGFCSTHG